MPSYYIHMDQGLVVDLRNHDLCSGQFQLKISHLNVLATVVRPTVVYVLSGGGSFNMGTMGYDLAQGHVAPVSALFAGVPVHTSFNGVSTYMAITVSEVAGALEITREFSFDDPLKTAAAIAALPDDVGFVGERSDAALAKWA